MNIENHKKDFFNREKKKKKNLLKSLTKEILNAYNKIYWYTYTKLKYLLKTYISKKYNRNNFISLLCISRERNQRLDSLLNSINEKTKYKKNIEVLILIDKDEPKKDKYLELINKYKSFFSIELYIEEFKKNTGHSPCAYPHFPTTDRLF